MARRCGWQLGRRSDPRYSLVYAGGAVRRLWPSKAPGVQVFWRASRWPATSPRSTDHYPSARGCAFGGRGRCARGWSRISSAHVIIRRETQAFGAGNGMRRQPGRMSFWREKGTGLDSRRWNEPCPLSFSPSILAGCRGKSSRSLPRIVPQVMMWHGEKTAGSARRLPAAPPTDPYVPNSGIRLVTSRVHCARGHRPREDEDPEQAEIPRPR